MKSEILQVSLQSEICSYDWRYACCCCCGAFCDPQFNSSLPSALHFYSAPNTPQRRLFDILTKAFKVSFPAVDIRPRESMETALSLENKSSFLLFFFVQRTQGCADLPSVYATGSGCPTAEGNLRAVCSSERGADGLGLALKTHAHTHTDASIHTLHWRKEALGVFFF